MNKRLITSQPDTLRVYLQKIWRYRMLAYSFSRRDIRIKFAQTWLGFGWTLIQPVIGVAIFTLFFSKVFKIDTGRLPYPIFAYLGLSSWNYFLFIFNQGASSVIDNQNLIKKVYFPRIILPISKVLTGGVDFALSILILFLLMPLFHFMPSKNMIFLPVFIFFNILTGITAALWLAALGLRKRDLYHIVPFISNFGIWLTPIFYTIAVFPENFRFLFYFNPMATVVEGYRWCLRGGAWEDTGLFINLGVVLVMFVAGLYYFRKKEDKMVDFI